MTYQANISLQPSQKPQFQQPHQPHRTLKRQL